MKYFEFGKENKELMVLLHGGGTSYLGVLPTAKKIAEKYHVILLAYDGFNPSEPETEFRSVAWEARGLEDYILQNYGGRVDILYGLSYGCRTLMQVLEDNRLQITTTIADGMSLRDYPDIKNKILKELYLFFFTGTFFVVMGRAGKLRKRFLAKITGRSIEEADRILYTKASWQSWKNQDKCLIGKKTDYSAFAHTDMHIWYGIKGTVDKKLSANLEELKAKGYPFTCKIFEDMIRQTEGGKSMTSQERDKITKRMLWIIPAMIPCIIGDYCMGLEPKDSTAVSFMISTGWLTIADWRIALSHIGGLIGTALYMIAALAFVRYLNEKLAQCSDKWGRRFLKLFIVGLYWGCMVFVYFHLACGTLIHTYNVIFEAVGGDTERAVTAWNRAYLVQAVPYWASFVVLELTTTVGWFAIIWKGVLPLKKRWVLAAPMLVAGIGFLLELILPLPFNGFASGFESLGWIVMFLGGIQAIKNDDREAD